MLYNSIYRRGCGSCCLGGKNRYNGVGIDMEEAAFVQICSKDYEYGSGGLVVVTMEEVIMVVIRL